MTYASSRMLSRYSILWDRSGARLVETLLFPLPEPKTDAHNLDGSVQIYTRNVRMAQATCTAFQIQCFFILQPLLVTKNPLTLLEQDVLERLEGHPRFGAAGSRFVLGFYERVAQEFSGDDRFIDASFILDRREQSDFYDLGHTSVQTSEVIGERTAQLILDRLQSAAGLTSRESEGPAETK